MADLLPVDVALERILATLTPESRVVEQPLLQALGQVLATDIHAAMDVPPFDNSAVDGYAYRSADVASAPTVLPISQRIPAGIEPMPLMPGTAARIFTGAVIPPGADCVAMQEDCVVVDQAVRLPSAKSPGNNIRSRGQDLCHGASVVSAGERLSPARLGLIASVGVASVPVRPPLEVAILSTGDEVIEPGEALRPGQIYNSNRYLLHGMLTRAGYRVADLGRIPDDLDATRAALQSAARSDFILSTGGVSVGEEDHVKTALDELGQLDLWRLAIKPGKPLAFGRVGLTPFMGLPGNPSAVFVTALILALPALAYRQGCRAARTTPEYYPADFTVTHPGKRREFCRVRLEDRDGQAWLVAHPNQSSGVLASASWATGLAVIQEGTCVTRGQRLGYLSFARLMESS